MTSSAANAKIWKPFLYDLQRRAPRPKRVPPIVPLCHPPPQFLHEFHGELRQTEAATLLQDEGEYLVRRSPGNSENTFTLSFRVNGALHHYHLYYDGKYFVSMNKKFDTLEDLVSEGLLTKFMDVEGGKYISVMHGTVPYPKSPHVTLNRSKRSKLKELDMKKHNFKVQNFKGLNWCELCGNFLWGFTAQGMKCDDCGIQVHHKCSEKVPHDCCPELKQLRGIFGVDLTTLAKTLGTPRPFIVEKCIEEIERRGIDVEGLYRVSGFSDEVEALKVAFDKGMAKTDVSPIAYENIHVITGILKQYLRLLPLPLITYECQPALFQALKYSSESEVLRAIRDALTLLPSAHYITLQYLVEHLSRVVARSEYTKMTALNMATVFNPTIMPMRPRLESRDGNFYLIAAHDRNLTLSTSGRGKITVNGDDIRGVIDDARNAARSTNSKDNIIASIRNDIRNILSERQAIYDRLSSCEAAYSGTNVSKIVPPQRGLTAQVRKLRRRVKKIEDDLRRNECLRNPCRNGGRCIDLYLDFLCLCLDGWEGVRCQADVNECADLIGTGLGCQNGGTCVNKPGTYECNCPAGFYGKHCTMNRDDCSAGPSSELCDHGTCVNQAKGKSGHECICDQGWEKAPGSVMCSVDVDECLKAPCSRSPKVNCINIPGAFRCESCPAGYTGNGFICDDIDECLNSNGGCSMNPKVNCFNSIGSFKCGPCPPGYSGDGVTCTYVGKCNVDHGGCHPQATCQEVGGNVVCTCAPRLYTGNGVGPNGCIPTGLAPLESTTPCSPSPCINGRCVPTSLTNYTCECFMGYSGVNCQFPRSPCEPNPCANGGTCRRKDSNGFKCICTADYTGTYCTQERAVCGGSLRGDEGILQFPSSPNLRYRPNLACAWRINVNSSLVIKLTFESFDLQPRNRIGECTNDWVQIYDGADVGHHNLLGKFCGNSLPNNGTLVSSDHYLLIWFRSDRSSNHMGFKLRWNATLPKCGGNVDGKVHGTFTSPGAPGLYPKNRDCYWRVSTFLNQRITFTFFKLNIENHVNCSYDYLEIFDGDRTDSSPLIRYCTTELPAPLVTPGHEATLHFHSDGIDSDKGFQISYSPTPGIPGCGGIFTVRRGQIRPVLEDGNNYRGDLDCAWLIRLAPDEQIKAIIESIDIEKIFGDCRHDFLEIRDGDNENAPLYGKFCGKDIPSPILSSGNTLYVRFHSDHSISGAGFLLTYEEVCNKVFPEPYGEIKSPNFPNQYTHSYDCYYTIDQPVGKAIRLDFQDFDLEKRLSFSPTCLDYLEIHDGIDINAPVLMKACGANRPGQIISTHNKLHMWFHTDASISGNGWSANYSTFDTFCGGVLTALKGNISSPAHPDGYPPDIVCSWVIALPPNHKIQITFLSFNLESTTANNQCGYDYVALFDNTTNHQLMTTLCGKKIPSPITSVGNVITIQFKTDASYAGDGFQLEYRAVNSSKDCGGNYFSSVGVIQSPNFPNQYPDDKICVWTINVPAGQKIKLRATNFSLEHSFTCMYDYLEIRNGKTENSPLIDKYCGAKTPPVITSLSNSLFLKFKSDALHTRSGFEISWDGSLTGCGGILTGTSGYITSPNYPEPYSANMDCYYTIRVSLGSRISLLFVDLELESGDDCIYDYIEIYDGPNPQSKSLGKFCTGVSNIDRIISSGNQMHLKFQSDGSLGGSGFNIRYSTDCNTRIIGATRGVIESPNYPEATANNFNCTWIITPLIMHTINITFADFTITSDLFVPGNCTRSRAFATLEIQEKIIRAQQSSSTELLGRYCHGVNPPTLISSRQVSDAPVEISIKLSTSMFFRSSFRLEWVEDGCGGRLTHPRGDFSSPGYPDLHPRRTTCIWQIAVDSNKAIILNIKDINMVASMQCKETSLSVYGGPDDSAPLLSKICEEHRDHISVQSSGNNMYVIFQSDILNTNARRGRGFSASYTTVSALDCGGLFSAPVGKIHSVNYPKNYGHHDGCTWILQADHQHRVELTFTDFDLIRSTNCTEAFVEVYDGYGQYAPNLLRHCGNRMPNASVLSTGNTLTVRMKSESQFSAKGFLAEYTWICGGTITVDSPGIFKPSFLHSLECTVTFVSLQPDGHITLSVYSDVDMNNGTDYSYVNIYEGDTVNGTRLGQVPNDQSQTMFTSNGNSITARFYFPKRVIGTMHIAYSSVSSACGGHLSALAGTIASPGYPGSYPVATECVWVIPAVPGNNVQLSFKSFDLQPSDSCNLDSVEVRKKDGEGALLGTFCGSNIPEVLTGEGIWMKFSSNGDGEVASGFLAEFSWVYLNEIDGFDGIIASPFYPQPIQRSLHQPLSWRITAPGGQKISITFTDFAADRRIQSTYLTIYDGYDASAKETELTGFPLPQPFKSTSNVVFLQMKASPEHKDSTAFVGSKFYLKWVAITEVWKPHQWKTAACGEDMQLSSNDTITIRSPNYPKRYPHNSRCTWVVRAPPGYHLSYRILHLDILETTNCVVDSIKFYDGEKTSNEQKPLHTYCLKNETHDRFSNVEVNGVLTVTFTSWYSNVGSGFEVEVRKEIGGLFKTSEGVFSVAADDFRKLRFKDYFEWRIVVGIGRKVNVTFEEFSVAASPDGFCSKEYVALRNGYHPDSPPLGTGKYCGTKPTSIPLTTSNELYVKAKSGDFGLAAFKLHFREVQYTCGGRLELTENVKSIEFTTPNYPHSPNPKLECVWVVRAPVGKTIQIDFIGNFDLMETSGCKEEYVEIRDGGTALAGMLGKYCSEVPNPLISSDNLLYVKYYTNATDPNNGFKAAVSIDKCGGVLRSESGVISTPGYPELPSETLDCTWTIHTTSHKLVSVNFTDFNIADVKLPNFFRSNACTITITPPTDAVVRKYPCILVNYNIGILTYFIPIREIRNIPGMLFSYINKFNNFVILYEDGLVRRPRPFMTRTFASPYAKMTPSQARESWSAFRFNRDIPNIIGLFYNENPPIPVTSTRSTIHIRARLNITRGYRGFKLSFKSARAECGGKLFTPDGIITSPRYPRMMSIPMYCEWVIQVPVGRRVSATFEDFDLSGDNSEQKVLISNDDIALSVIGVFGRSTRPTGVFKSSGNIMVVTLISRTSSGSLFRGFKLKYSSDEPAACGGFVNTTELIIEPPKNMTSFDCIWHLSVATGINISHIFWLENAHVGNMSLFCSYRETTGLFLAAEGESQYSICGDVSDQSFGIAMGDIKISAISSLLSPAPFAFRLKYKTANCGGFVSPSMLPYVITSPNYPNDYPKNVDCAWRVSTNAGQTLKVTIDEFLLPPSCQDYLQVRSGATYKSPLIESYCDTLPSAKTLVSEGEDLFFYFHAGAEGQAKRFQITIDTNHTECGGLIRSTSTQLMSPNYPAKYGNDMECEWEINAEPGFHIGLVFMERFQLEASTDCKNDSVQVFDYIDGKWDRPTLLCGRNMPSSINSTGTKLKVVFRSNADIVGDGFKARWEANCGGFFTSGSGTIISPKFPNLYPNNLHCEYRIENQEKLFIEFQYFELEPPSGSKCLFDYLEIAEDTSKIMVPVFSKRKFCGNALPGPFQSGKNIVIVFHTDVYAQRRGFKLTYKIDDCGGRITKPTVIEKHWSYPDVGKPCNWTIEAPSNMVVSIIFTDVNLPGEAQCRWWGSIVLKEPSMSATTKATICGTHDSPIPIVSSSNILELYLTRLALMGNYSFTALVTFTYGEKVGCGGRINVKDNPEILVSPDTDRDGKYEDLLDCHWIIEASEAHFLTAKFLALDVNSCNSTNCSCDFVEIRDGAGPLSDLIQKTCGSNATEAVSSSSNVLWIRFKTDGSYNGKGFTLQLSARASPCGLGRLRATTEIQKLISPNYPNSYPANTRCSWLIIAETPNITGNRYSMHRPPYIHLHLHDWDMEEAEDCSNDYLTFEDPPVSEQMDGSQRNRDNPSGGGVIYVGSEKQIHRDQARWTPNGRSRYCGSSVTADFYAVSGKAIVRFVSNEAISGKGFSLEYSTNVCGRNYTGFQGRIRLNYVQPNTNCHLSIEAPSPNHTISLYFGKFHIPSTLNCTSGFFQANEGSSSGKEVLRACSYQLPSPVFSSGSKLFLTAYDPVGYRIDVDATYTTTDQGPGCGGIIDNHAGVFTSPFYPNYVRNNSVCLWRIFVPEGLKVNMHFAAFDLGSSSTCNCDFIEFFDCDDFGTILNLHSKFCGGDYPGVVKGAGNVMAVKYTRSVNNGGIGWQINFAGLAAGYSIKEWSNYP